MTTLIGSRRAERLHLRLGVAIGALGVAIGGPVGAQEAASTIDELVVTAQKRAENVQDVPLSITAATGETLEALRVTQPQQLTLIDPSVRFKQSLSNSTSGFLIRGIGTSSFSAGIEQSISTVVDGVVLADPGSLSTLADVERVEILRGPQGMLFGKNASAGVVSIVTKRPVIGETSGSAHVEYGAMDTRVLQFVENIALGDKAAVRLVQTYNHRDGSMRNVLTGQKIDPQDVVTLAAKFQWNGERLGVFASADYTVSDDFCCAQAWRQAPAGYPPALDAARYGFTIGPKNRVNSAGGQSFGNADTYGGSLQLEYDLGGGYSLTSITAARSSYRFTSYDGDLASANYVDAQQNIPRVRQLSQELRIASPTGGALDYVAGLYLYAQEARLTVRQVGRLEWANPGSSGQIFQVVPIAPGDQFDARRHTKTESRSVAAFSQVNYQVTPQLRLLAGARITYDDLDFDYYLDNTPGFRLLPGSVVLRFAQSTDNTNLSYRLGAQYDVTPDVMVYASVARGYKGPGFSGYTVTSPTADERVRPEIPTSYEIGMKSAFFDRRVLFNFNLFKADIKDFQAQVSDLSNPTYSAKVLNAANLSTKGVEASLVLRLTETLRVAANGAYTDAHYENFPGVACYFGQPKVAQGGPCVAPPSNPASLDGVFNADGLPLAGTPKYAYQINASYERPIGNGLSGYARLNWDWQDDVNYSPNGDPGTIQKAFGVLGGSIGIQAEDGAWRLGLWAVNLLDKRWAPQISASPVTSLNPGGYSHYWAPDSFRRYGVSLDARF
ncbi:MAG: TonB-dependent receptor [Phenylobacterium sp.]|nr:TonB-dependent receptor [Phenylobacterium sp.]